MSWSITSAMNFMREYYEGIRMGKLINCLVLLLLLGLTTSANAQSLRLPEFQIPNIKQMTIYKDGICREIIEYDSTGNIILEKSPNDKDEILAFTLYHYDEQNRLLAKINSSTINGPEALLYDYSNTQEVYACFVNMQSKYKAHSRKLRKFLQKAQNIEDLRAHKAIRKLLNHKVAQHTVTQLNKYAKPILEYVNLPNGSQLINDKYIYDVDGSYIRYRYPENSISGQGISSIEYYDREDKLLKSIRVPIGHDAFKYVSKDSVTYVYNELGQETKRYSWNLGEKRIIKEHTYNELNQLLARIDYNKNGSVRSKMEYHYDNDKLVGATEYNYTYQGIVKSDMTEWEYAIRYYSQ